jgi:hypothetical protein
MLDCDAGFAELERKYFKKLSAVFPAFTVAKFLQMKHRIELIMDMQVESSIPILDHVQKEPAR